MFELFFHRLLFSKSSQRKVRQASQVQQNKSLKGKKKKKEKLMKTEGLMIYTTADIFFGVAVPVNHSTNSWYSSHKVKNK